MADKHPRFTSSCERRLWVAAGTAVIAVYVSIPLAGILVETLQRHGLLDFPAFAFGAAFLTTILVVLALGLRRRPTPGEIWIVLGVLAAFVMVVVRMGLTPVERTHLFEYGLLSVLFYEAASERRRGGSRMMHPFLFAVAVTSTLGWGDEAVQAFLPERVYDVRDVGVNALAAIIGATAAATLRHVRGRTAGTTGTGK
ncbi:MAG: VanZ family protein [Gemmatimonadota bacterium]